MFEKKGPKGLQNGKLYPCPGTPNCASSESMAPLPYRGNRQQSLARLRQTLTSLQGTEIVTQNGLYLHAEHTSGLFRFVDDIEFLFDDQAKCIHFRSASRIGYSDMGANRKRMEAITALYLKSASD